MICAVVSATPVAPVTGTPCTTGSWAVAAGLKKSGETLVSSAQMVRSAVRTQYPPSREVRVIRSSFRGLKAVLQRGPSGGRRSKRGRRHRGQVSDGPMGGLVPDDRGK